MYRIINDQEIQLIDGPYEGTVYQYGAVKLNADEQKDQLTISFEYSIIHGEGVKDLQEFRQYIGDILQEIIYEKIDKKEIVFKGGVDG
jgi:hypothetical protein